MEQLLNELLMKAKKNNNKIFMGDFLDKTDKLKLSDEDIKELLFELDKRNISLISDEEFIDNIPELKTDSVSSFIRETRNYALLTKEEEIELAEKIKEGDKNAFEKLCNSNLRLVFSVARKYSSNKKHNMALEDLLQEGCTGLMTAAKNFDATKGFKFSTYATWWIRQAITRAIANQSRNIRVPVHAVDRLSKYKKLCQEYEQKYHRYITDKEACIILKISQATLDNIKLYTAENVRLDEPLKATEEGTATLKDYLADESEFSKVQDCADNSALMDTLEDLIDQKLDCKEEIVIKKRFGIGYPKTYTLEEIAQDYGLTRERIRQIQGKALRKLQTPNCKKALVDYLD